MKKILITGIQGSGKSTVADELKKRGYKTVDSDDISRWVDKSGPLTEKRPPEPTIEWLNTHAWVWDQKKLNTILNQDLDYLLLCGISWDQEKYYSLFDIVILLSLDEEVVRQRLNDRDNGNIFGKHSTERDHILKKLDGFQKAAKESGAFIIDARKSLNLVMDEVTRIINL